MLVHFFLHLKNHGLPVTIRELMDLLNSVELLNGSIDSFYHMARLTLVKDERFYDRFDTAFSSFLNGENSLAGLLNKTIPKEWLSNMAEQLLSNEEKAKIQSLGGFEELMKAFHERLNEQQTRHQGGNKWIGTGGTSPFGAYGYNPEGIRIGQDSSRHQRAIKVWDKREFKNLDEDTILAKRNMTIALRRLRQTNNKGPATQFDLETTIQKTAQNAGLLDLNYKPAKQDDLKVLMLYDVGGSMDYHVELTQTVFSAAKSSFKTIDYFYFHNCPYETLWKDNQRRSQTAISTIDLIRRFNADYKVIIIGDASMSPYELLYAGGSVEHMNDEPGKVWLQRIIDHFSKLVWLNPLDRQYWHTPSVTMINQLLNNRMYPLSIHGIADAMRTVSA